MPARGMDLFGPVAIVARCHPAGDRSGFVFRSGRSGRTTVPGAARTIDVTGRVAWERGD